MSIALAWSDCKTYCETIGPGREEPPRPAECEYCDGDRVWLNGWRRVWPTVLVDGRPYRPPDGVALRRVRCARRACRQSWTLRPPWLYPQRSLEPDVAEAAALAYLLEPATSYATVAAAFGVAWVTVWRWVGWLATLASPAALVGAAARLGATVGADTLVPRAVPAAARARSAARAASVLTAAQLLVVLTVLHRAQPRAARRSQPAPVVARHRVPRVPAPGAADPRQPDFDALWQRLVVRASLAPLTDRENAEYLERRLRAVGARAMLFRAGAVDLLFQHSRGVMRRVNYLATGALLAAARASRKHVDAADVQAAVFDDEHA